MTKKIIMPFIRTICPNTITQDIIGVQPMSEDIDKVLSFRIRDENDQIINEFGNLIHSFIYGYQVYNGKEFIVLDDFLKNYGKDKIKNWNKDNEE